MAYVVDKAEIDRAIDNMAPVDPMRYNPAVTAAYNARRQTNAKIKHIILLGDGDAEDSYYPLVTQIHKDDITISAVVTGGGTYGFGADYGTMQTLRAGAAGAMTRRKPRCAAAWGAQHGYPHSSVVVDGRGTLFHRRC